MPLVDPFSTNTAALTEARIIPDVLGSFAPTAPNEEDISTDGLIKNNCDSVRYTLAMFDPDAPSAAQPTSSQFRHWVITGLMPTGDPTPTALQPTPAANAHRPPGPPKGSGIHRYTFALFREPPNFSLPEGASELDPSIEARRRWDAVKFGERNGLQLVGAAFYLVRGED
ncbi:PEBP-like protein [Mycena sanguinolenta]|nr:PEBP-like protein [Mycena sanguinolenta]